MADATIPQGSRTTAVGFLDNPQTINYLAYTQRLSSFVFTGYLALHFATTGLVPLATASIPASEPYLLAARRVYHSHALAEIGLIVVPIAAHFTSGVGLRLLRRRANLARQLREDESNGNGNGDQANGSSEKQSTAAKQRSRKSAWPPLSYISLAGYFFAVIITPHLQLQRLVPLLVESGSGPGADTAPGLAFVAHIFARRPGVAQLLYVPLVAIGAAHVVWGWAKWTGLAVSTREARASGNGSSGERGKAKRWRFWGLHALAFVIWFTWSAGGLGVAAGTGAATGEKARVYDRILAAVWL